MAIFYDENAKTISIDTEHTTYQMKIGPYGVLLHTYYGKRISGEDMSYLFRYSDIGFSTAMGDAGMDRTVSLDTMPQEMPSFNVGDYRVEGIRVQHGDGSYALDLRYVSHEIMKGKYGLEGLPAMYGGNETAETLRVVLKDRTKEFFVTLLYGIYEELDIITRACLIENREEETAVMDKAVSMSMDFLTADMDIYTFNGRHEMEREVERRRLGRGVASVGSVRGTSSHQHNPFVILCRPDTEEEHGECYGFSYVYSGNFLAEAEISQLDRLRFTMGIHPSRFRILLEKGRVFTMPEVIMSYSGSGLGRLSIQFHRAIRNYLCRGKYKNSRRPVLINNWEATYFDFTGEKLISIAEEAAKLGIEMLVMDDGWFGKRNLDESGLGDWIPNEEKLGMSLHELIGKIKEKGLAFGIWIEPEMVSEDSILYREHPDWAFALPGRTPGRGRCQLVLDLGRECVRDYLYQAICRILDTGDISYVKWDMNRSICDVYNPELPPEQQGEAGHRYILGLYNLLEKITSRYPNVLLEGCSGGGGRFDAGMLYYSPQIWCSDDTDAIERLKIQYGTSFCYPVSTVGSHVSTCPNHQNGRITPLHTRGVVAMAGTFGYELDISKMSAQDKEEIKVQIEDYKKYFELIQDGDYYRLTKPEEDFATWQFVSKDRGKSLVNAVMTSARANAPDYIVRFRGLEPESRYMETDTGKIYQGSTLMHGGYLLPRRIGEYQSYQLYFVRV
ncbi:MAG: alpha-galactosidase [Kineothrix sp.]|nr:alpha-galactosidase [Kineothrix sp.]